MGGRKPLLRIVLDDRYEVRHLLALDVDDLQEGALWHLEGAAFAGGDQNLGHVSHQTSINALRWAPSMGMWAPLMK